ncbi:Chromo domain-containing protein [Madurella fahalii]|uniref:Chromo domain-containing protein n=1 Tax=Madurella fahalii TaxID=1157608 RepID=A0ABQ0GP58_9PEZI
MAAPKKAAGKAQRNKKLIQNRLLRAEKEGQKDQIARLEEALKQKDEELAALTAEELQAMDIDNDEGQDNSDENKDDDTTRNEGQGGEEVVIKKEEDEESTTGKVEEKEKAKVGAEQNNKASDEALFVGDGPDVDSDSDSDSAAFFDEENHKALFTFPGTQPAKDAKTVGWTSGRSTDFINMHGKKSAARYRIERSAYPAEYEDNLPAEEKVSNPKNRYGDERLDNGKFKYTKRHIRGIFGVAWKSAGTRTSRNDLDDINPDLVNNWRNTITYVLIAWQIGESIQKSWEPRSCLRDRWGKKDADLAIYEAAVEAEDRYMEAKTGNRPAKSRSPSAGLAESHIRKHREKSLGVGRSSPSRSTRAKSSKSPQSKTKSLDELKDQFLANYFELLGVEDFADLSRDEKRDCIAAWEEEKLAAAAA